MIARSTSPPERVRPAAALTRTHVLRALVRRDWQILRSYRTSLVSDLVFGFLNLVAYYFISRTVRARVDANLQGAPTYFDFAAAGIALSVVLQAATVGVTRRIREEQLTGTLEMLVVQPIASAEIALGLAGFPFLFAVARALVYLLLAGLLLGLSLGATSWPGLVTALVAAGLSFSAIGVALAALVLVFKRAEVLGGALVFGMSLLGGAVFPTQVLPSWLAPLSYLVPTRYAFNAMRGALFGAVGWVGPSLVLLGFTVVALPLALALFSAAVRYNARRGALNQY